ncbi:MAG: hypothetical protein JWQ66_3612 [Mucilaginibacter sp.]|nr:hypothetical protein [Mucilaginibacter sp.]
MQRLWVCYEQQSGEDQSDKNLPSTILNNEKRAGYAKITIIMLSPHIGVGHSYNVKAVKSSVCISSELFENDL